MVATAAGTGAIGPLTVSSVNPRYFAAALGGSADKLVYLTGSHVNNNLHDGLGPGRDCPESPERFDFDAYLAMLAGRGHNFIRLWRWEQFQGYLPAPADVHFCMTPQPWARTGPGSAKDGMPKFDLSTFDEAYFQRVRERVETAGRRGMYVSVMLFEGFSLHLTEPPDNIQGHPFSARNNINQMDIGSIVDYQVLPLKPEVEALQMAYIRKVVDTVHDLPNVLYEVANESSGRDAESVEMPDGSTIATRIGDSTQWQYWVIGVVKDYEREQGYDRHPVGMTFLYPVAEQSAANDPLWASPADWISPGMDDVATPGGSRWSSDPPANDGTKVVLLDTDHFSPFGADALWVWKAFLRGHNPLLFDLAILGGGGPQPGTEAGTTPPFDSLEPARHAMGETRRLAETVDLAGMQPRGDLASSGFALADPGREYLALQDGDSDVTVMLEPGGYTARWRSVDSRETVDADPVTVDRAGPVAFKSPFQPTGAAVLQLTSRSA